jgi:5'-3' exonuclease
MSSNLTALIDGDIVCYRCAAVAENDPVERAIELVAEMVRRINYEVASYDYSIFLTGSNNYRYTYNPEYKANRKDLVRPKWLEQCREYLVLHENAKVTDGDEADDEMAIAQTKMQDNSIICSIDKDLLQVPGWHYNFVKQEKTYVTPKQALFNFYWQFIMGDKSDNIMGYDGKARQNVPKFLEPLYEEMQHAAQMGTEQDVFDIVRQQYNEDDQRLLMNGICLWLQREEGQIWKFPS